MKSKNISVAIVTHISNEFLSDGNTGKKITGRLKLFKLVLKSLFLFNDMKKINLAVFDTGNCPKNILLKELSEFGFDKITTSSKPGLFVDNLNNSNRIYFKYKHIGKLRTELKYRGHRFLESCEAALKYSIKINSPYLLLLEGDTIIFGKNYLKFLEKQIKGKRVAFNSSRLEIHTDFWLAEPKKILKKFQNVYRFFLKPYHVEKALAKTFPNRIILDDILPGHKALDQKLKNQRTKKLPKKYYRLYPYSWITHISQKQIKDIKNYLNELENKKEIKIKNYEFTRNSQNIKEFIKKGYYEIKRKLLRPLFPIPYYKILKKAEKNKELIIQPIYGGLGDHLLYSSLPRLLWEQKKIITFISNNSLFRNKGIKKFVWENNPYIKFTNRKGWFLNKVKDTQFSTRDEYLQKLFNLQGKGKPEVYYKPNSIKKIQDKTIIDVSFGGSGKANGYLEEKFQKNLIKYIKIKTKKFILITHNNPNKLEQQIIKKFNPKCYKVNCIEKLADVLFSANKRYLLYTGTASVAAALGLPSTILCNKKSSPYFQYEINKYINIIK